MPKEKGTNNIIFQIHGGGYIVALCDPYRDTAVKYSEMVGGARSVQSRLSCSTNK